jgi:hypothetical protein
LLCLLLLLLPPPRNDCAIPPRPEEPPEELLCPLELPPPRKDCAMPPKPEELFFDFPPMPVAILKASVCDPTISVSSCNSPHIPPSTHLEPSITLLRIVRAVALVVISLAIAIVVPVPISKIFSLTRLRERVRHCRYWCSSWGGDLWGSRCRDVPGRFAGADLDKVVLARFVVPLRYPSVASRQVSAKPKMSHTRSREVVEGLERKGSRVASCGCSREAGEVCKVLEDIPARWQ